MSISLYDFAENLNSYHPTEWLADIAAGAEANAEQQYKPLLEKQWDAGEDGNGQKLPGYSRETELIAETANPLKPKVTGQPYNLMWSGQLFRQTKLTASAGTEDIYFTVDSDAESKEPLFERLKNTINNPDTIFKLEEPAKDDFIIQLNDDALKILKTNLKI